MTAIYSSAALKNRQREVKDAALVDVVHITENGNGAFIFCSEEIFERKMLKAQEEALYEARLSEALDRADDDIVAGRFFTNTEEARQAAEMRRAQGV
ncbi:MAG: hypothetical protein RR866_01230 [Raoultibacter sp.]